MKKNKFNPEEIISRMREFCFEKKIDIFLVGG